MRVDADDFARPCGDGKMHHEIKEILIEPGAVNALEEAMSEGFLKEYISPLLICDTNTCKATEKLMEDIFDRCQVLVLDADDLGVVPVNAPAAFQRHPDGRGLRPGVHGREDGRRGQQRPRQGSRHLRR